MPTSAHASSGLAVLATGALVVDASDRARLQLTGPDVRAFLHRLSTNHVNALPPGQGRLNALLTDKGRLVELVHHLDRGDSGVLLVGSPDRGADLTAWLDRYLFSERVELSDLSARGSMCELFGRAASEVADSLVAGAAALPPWGFVEQGTRMAVRSFDRVDVEGQPVPLYFILDHQRSDIADVVMERGVKRAAHDVAERARIAAGAPGHTGEIVERFNPLDLGLHDAIHWAKGCYIGQEVIARLDTYQKQSKRLMGLVLAPQDADRLQRGAQVVADGVAVGEVTSVVPSTQSNDTPSLALALAVAKLPATHGLSVGVRVGDDLVSAVTSVPITAQTPHD